MPAPLEDWHNPPPETDTIVAISTPPGRGGIGIVRLSGPGSIAIAARLVEMSGQLGDPSQHARARRGRILDPNRNPKRPEATIDDALITVFHAPHSYTGETLVEIAAHGAPVVLAAIVAGALAEGARLVAANRLDSPVRLARPGEFTQRAFLSGRLDLTQAEAVHDLIAAQTLDQARVAAQQLGGALSRRVTPAKESLLYIITLLEAGMDFASGELDDVDVVAAAQIAAGVEAARTPLEALAASFQRGQLLRDGAAIAIVGPANAGKSSLFNRLLERERAIVTPVPGTTRDTVEESLSLGGIPLRLIDTAGLRDLEFASASEAKSDALTASSARHSPAAPGDRGMDGTDSEAGPQTPPQGAAQAPLAGAEWVIGEAERQGIVRSREALADADLVLLVHDATQPLTAAERTLAASLADRPHLLVWNKTDLLPRSISQGLSSEMEAKESGTLPEWNASRTASDPAPARNSQAILPAVPEAWLPASALTGAGFDALRAAILHELHAEGELAAEGELNNLRQQQAVSEALAALANAAAANTSGLPHELILMDLHAALDSLDSLTGATTPDDILARIFSTFCIGK